MEQSPESVASAVREAFGISRQAVNGHLRRLCREGILEWSGHTRARQYRLASLSYWSKTFPMEPGLAEDVEDWVWEHLDSVAGTAVFMKLRNETRRTTKEVFDRFLSGDDYAVTETVVPVRAVRHGDEQLVSRSQAKRLLARVEQFRTVRLDFIRIDAIGPAFADEIFRVFALRHPDVELVAINTNADVERMIARAKGSARAGTA